MTAVIDGTVLAVDAGRVGLIDRRLLAAFFEEGARAFFWQDTRWKIAHCLIEADHQYVFMSDPDGWCRKQIYPW